MSAWKASASSEAAGDDHRFAEKLKQLHDLLSLAPELGSLIDPSQILDDEDMARFEESGCR